ncbi:hypothetical protein TherJR_0338 [Thermincola potens JR]|uniref:Uncharacterized protein n=1 Tax=Thermincola potens (strain JR) TaxID=635013 RepID=D5XAC5_THEPJ|nr:hypothetical protein TherJR_0338 [Thermincola potens JR]
MLPVRSYCARKIADKKAGGSRMFEDGEGCREVRRSTQLSVLDGRRPNY